MVSMNSLFGIMEFEKAPITFGNFGSYLITWLQDAGGFAAMGLALWVVYVLATPHPNVVGSRGKLISRFTAITGLIALVFYVVAAGLLFVGMARKAEASPPGQQPQVQAPAPETDLDRLQNHAITIGGFFALLAFCEPFFLDIGAALTQNFCSGKTEFQRSGSAENRLGISVVPFGRLVSRILVYQTEAGRSSKTDYQCDLPGHDLRVHCDGIAVGCVQHSHRREKSNDSYDRH